MEKQPSTALGRDTARRLSTYEKALDAAWTFLDEHVDSNIETSAADLKAMRRKIDGRILPLMFACYTMQFLDKVMLNYAAVMGIQGDLNLRGNDYSNVAIFLFVGLLCFEVPNIYFLQMVPAATWLGINVTLWGIAAACGAAAHSYQTLLVSRIFLGIFEATTGPSLIIISSQWYTKSEQAPRFSFWYCGLGLGQILGGVISYGFQHVAPTAGSFAGWRIMFVVQGCVTVIVGLSTILYLPDTPMKAHWLSDTEKVALLKHVSVNMTGIRNRNFQPRQILEALMDVQFYLMALAVILLSVTSGIITTYSATLIRNLGYGPKDAALMNMPSGIVNIFSTLAVGFGVRKQSNRWFWILCCLLPAITGSALLSFLPATNRSGCLVGLYLVNTVVAALPILYAWTAANFSGATKRAFAAAMVSGSFSIGNIIGPLTFQARDAPHYRPAKLAAIGTQAGCAAVTILLYAYYRVQNGRRDQRRGAVRGGEEKFMEPEVWASMTDKESWRFRYCY